MLQIEAAPNISAPGAAATTEQAEGPGKSRLNIARMASVVEGNVVYGIPDLRVIGRKAGVKNALFRSSLAKMLRPHPLWTGPAFQVVKLTQ